MTVRPELEIPRVLFVCQANIGRSQVGEAFLNAIYPDMDIAGSAGTQVDAPWQTVGEREESPNVVQVMLEHGLSIAGNKRQKVTPDLAQTFGHIVIMTGAEIVEPWLLERPHERWDVQDLKGLDLEATRQGVEGIRRRVIEMTVNLGVKNITAGPALLRHTRSVSERKGGVLY